MMQISTSPTLLPTTSSTLSSMNQLSLSNKINDASNVVPDHQRLNGFERPFSRDQVISWIGHSVSGFSFFIGAIGVYLYTEQGRRKEIQTSNTVMTWTLLTVIAHVINSIILVISWRSCETIDPAAPVDDTLLLYGWWGRRLRGPRWEKTRYCAMCRKSVPGLDHHCTWLQTCIGRANYAQFFIVATTGTVQFVLQVMYAGLCLLWLHDHMFDDVDTFGYVISSCLILCFVISVPCMFMYFVLVGFHLWLMMLGYGTYDWILRRRKTQRAKLEAKKTTKHTITGDSNSSKMHETVSIKTGHAAIKIDDVKLDKQDHAITVR